jgi:hypothetical protein
VQPVEWVLAVVGLEVVQAEVVELGGRIVDWVGNKFQV